MVEMLTQFVIALLLSFLLGWPICAALERFRILDQPKQRSNHTAPTPRGGGIAILFVVASASLWLGRQHLDRLTWLLPLIVCLVGIISLIDDIRGLSAGIRFATHIVGAAILVWGLESSTSVGLATTLASRFQMPYPLGLVLMLFWVVGYTNAFNFMDGINGIAGMQAGLGALAMAVVTGVGGGSWCSAPLLIALSVSGAALGFLPYNFPRARMFMGDVGSAPLGMLLAFLVLWICRDHGFRLFIPLAMIHTNFILDTAVTLVRRIASGDRWLEAHKDHFYQRMVSSGYSHTAVTYCEGFLLIMTSLVSIIVARSSTAAQFTSLVTVIIMWCIVFGLVEIRYRKMCGVI